MILNVQIVKLFFVLSVQNVKQQIRKTYKAYIHVDIETVSSFLSDFLKMPFFSFSKRFAISETDSQLKIFLNKKKKKELKQEMGKKVEKD